MLHDKVENTRRQLESINDVNRNINPHSFPYIGGASASLQAVAPRLKLQFGQIRNVARLGGVSSVNGMRRLNRILIIAVILVINYTLFGFVFAPSYAKYFGERYLREHVSPSSTIRNIRINPFRASIHVEGLLVSDHTGAWSVAWEHLELNLSASTLFRFYPVVDALRLDRLDLRFERQPVDKPLLAASSQDEPIGWREQIKRFNLVVIPDLQIDLLEVTQGRFQFMDRTTTRPYAKSFESIDFTLRDLTTVSEGQAGAAMRFSAATEEGGQLEWEGSFENNPIRSSGSFSLGGLALHDLSPYFDERIQFDLQRAVLGIQFEYHLDLSDEMNLLRITDGQIALTELLLESAEDAGPLAAIESLQFEGIDFLFPAMALEVSTITVRDGATWAVRDGEGAINLLRLMAPPGSVNPGASRSQDPKDSLPDLRYRVGLLRVADYHIALRDERSVVPVDWVVDVVQLDLSDITSNSGEPIRVSLETIIGESGSARMEGQIVADGPELDLTLHLESIPLAPFSGYALSSGGGSLSEGSLDLRGALKFSGPTSGLFGGDLAVHELSFQHEKALEGKWEALKLNGLTVSWAPLSVAMKSVDLKGPSIRWTQTAPPSEAKDVALPEASPGDPEAIALRIDEFIVSGGGFVFKDARFDPAPTVSFDAIEMFLEGLNLIGDTPANLTLASKVNGSELSVQGSILGSQYKKATSLQASLKGLPLPGFSDYSGQSVGRRIRSGRFSMESDWQILSSQLRATNQLRIESFELGDRVESEQAVRLPLDLAVSLLKGPNSVMDLALPLSGDLSDPKLGMGQIIRTAIFGLITNIASAPFKLLGNLVGGGEDLSAVGFAAGSAELSPGMTARLDALASALRERPALSLILVPSLAEADIRQLSMMRLRRELLKEADPNDQRLFLRRLTQRYREIMEAAGTPDRKTDAAEEEGLDKMTMALLPEVVLPKAESRSLAESRAAAVLEYLTGVQGLPTDRLSVGEPVFGAEESAVVFELN